METLDNGGGDVRWPRANNGNRTRETTGTSITDYTYTANDQLAGIDQGLREVGYEYDGLGRALVEEVSSLLVLQNRTEQLWDGMVVVARESTAGGSTSLVRDVTGDVALQATDALLGTDTRWALTDRLGSTIGQTQGSKITQLATYSDWGVPTFGTAGWSSETGYTGELGDATAGVWNFYARSYDPMAATWLHADPYRGTLDNPQSQGRYAYVGNNPVTTSDAFGFMARMQTETRQGMTKAKLARQLDRGDQIRMLNVVNANRAASNLAPVDTLGTSNGKKGGPKPQPRTPKESSQPAARHGDTETLLAVLDTVGTIAGFAAFLPGPQQPVLAAIAAIAGAAAAFTRCATGGINADCMIAVIFAALGPIGKGLKHVIGPIIKQALGGTKAVTTSTRATKPATSAQRPAPSSPEATTDEMVDVWRTVGPDEAADIARTGAYRVQPGGEGKYFFPSKEQAENLGRMFNNTTWAGPQTLTRGQVPRGVLDRAEPLQPAGEGPAVFVRTEDLSSICNVTCVGPIG